MASREDRDVQEALRVANAVLSARRSPRPPSAVAPFAWTACLFLLAVIAMSAR